MLESSFAQSHYYVTVARLKLNEVFVDRTLILHSQSCMEEFKESKSHLSLCIPD